LRTEGRWTRRIGLHPWDIDKTRESDGKSVWNKGILTQLDDSASADCDSCDSITDQPTAASAGLVDASGSPMQETYPASALRAGLIELVVAPPCAGPIKP
jgi:hypothetical protein